MAEEYSTFWEHFTDLRKMLLRILLVILLGSLCSFFFYKDIFYLLSGPLQPLSANHEIQANEVKRERIFNSGAKESTYHLPQGAELIYTSFTPKIFSSNFIFIPSQQYIEIERVIPATQLVLLGPLEGMLMGFKVSFWLGFVG